MTAPVETGKVSVSLQRLRYLERDSEECGALKRQLSEVKRERDSLKQQLAERDAECAEMREALEAVLSHLTDYLNTISMVDEEAKFQAVAECIDRTKAVLSSPFGSIWIR